MTNIKGNNHCWLF